MKKRNVIKLSITVVLLIALTCWVNSRWNAWFGNPPEPPYSPLSEPGRVLLTFGDKDALSRNISWQYDSVVHPSHVELTDTLTKDTLYIKAQGETFQSRSGKAAYYVARLRSLRPSRYYNPQIQISAESETKRSIFRKRDKTKRSKKESAQHSKSRNKSFVMTSVSAL